MLPQFLCFRPGKCKPLERSIPSPQFYGILQTLTVHLAGSVGKKAKRLLPFSDPFTHQHIFYLGQLGLIVTCLTSAVTSGLIAKHISGVAAVVLYACNLINLVFRRLVIAFFQQFQKIAVLVILAAIAASAKAHAQQQA